MLVVKIKNSRLRVQIGYLPECLDFWRHNLKGQESAKQNEAPKLIWYQCRGDLPPGKSTRVINFFMSNENIMTKSRSKCRVLVWRLDVDGRSEPSWSRSLKFQS